MVRRVLFIIVGVLIALVVIAAVLGVVFVRSTFPQVDGEVVVAAPDEVAAAFPSGASNLPVSGLEAPVTVYRDEWGVPHIYADNAHDLFFAQGYIHAQDRLWQMDFQRRIGSGTLSEVLGEATIEQDRFLRTLGPHRAAQKDLALLSPETLSYLQAYADGVNAFIADNQDNLPLEFRILGYQPEPWQPQDTVTWGILMAYQLGGNYEDELMSARLISLMGEEKAADLLPPYPEEGPFIIPPEVQDYSALRSLDTDRLLALRRLLKADGPGIGSNNWVVSGSRSTTGMPLLANDPHLGMQIPSIWYEVGLHGGGFDVVGVSFAGSPGVIVGHNGRIAWGVTNVGPDVQDLYIEKVNPANPNQVEFQGAWEDVQVVEETIQVKGRTETMVETVRITRHGPIMNAVLSGLDEGAAPLALRWTALEGSTLVESIMRYNRAQNWEEFRAALRDFSVPSQNFVYADVDGNIGYQMPGLIPIRAQGNGTVPVPGWTGEYEWTGFIPFDELPSVFNPSSGYVATANNQVVPNDYPYLITTTWAAPYRARRIVELIESQEKLSVDDMSAIQADIHPVTTDIFIPLLDGRALTEATAETQEALELLLAWDRKMDADKPEPLIYQQFLQELAKATLGDELEAAGGPDLVEDYFTDFRDAPTQLLESLAADPTNPWWDDVTTGPTETQAEIVARAFPAAVATLQAGYGKDPARWQYGDAHWANFDHPLGAVQPLDRIFNRSIPARGEAFTVNSASGRYPDLVMDWGSSFRQVVDLGNLANSRIVNTTGQSGLPFYKHYDDMIETWQAVEYHPMRFDRSDIEQSAKDMLVLQPSTP